MRPKEVAVLIKNIKDRGYIEHEDVFYPPKQAEALGLSKKKRSRKPVSKHSDKQDAFCMFIKQQLGIDMVMEFKFSSKRNWRFDYANEELMIGIEQEGGVWSGGRHTRGQGYINDMEKYNDASLNGWTLIRRTPDQLLTHETVDLIRSAITYSSNE